jgi:hypothetical protein
VLCCITNIFSWEWNNPLFVIHWSSYNQSLVRRGRILFSYDFLDIWDDDLARMNENKNGKKYKFTDSFILVIGYIRVYLHLPYRQTEGIIKATGKNLLFIHAIHKYVEE